MIGTVTGWDATTWVLLAFLAALVYCVVAPVVYGVVSALLFVRRYYRNNPDAEPPDALLVHLGLVGVRPLPRRVRNPW